jgi:hypothetical protein
MNRIFFTGIFALGLAAVVWVGFGFVGASPLALLMTAVIAGVYGLGAFELHRYRVATASLATALDRLPQPLTDLSAWLAGVHPSLQPAVRQRIEGERTALPGPALTPYLVGLLVMLGMLGTFLGMVVTFKGAVFALEGSTDLQAIRSALAAPIKGLGLSFGTSVAGVAASAMLGLMSALSRRERVDVGRLLDSRIATVLRPFSLVHQRQETFKALQVQATALPEVVSGLQALMEGMERRNQQLNEQLLASQAQFHREVTTVYTGLADSVGQIAERRPDGQRAPCRREHQARGRHRDGRDRAGIEAPARARERRSAGAAERPERRVQRHRGHRIRHLGRRAADPCPHQSDAQVQALDRALTAFTDSFDQRAGALLASVHETASRQASQSLGDMNRLLAQSEALVSARIDAEAQWTQQHGERMDQLAGLLRSELGALREDEAARGDAAVQRLGELQAALATHLATLGTRWRRP